MIGLLTVVWVPAAGVYLNGQRVFPSRICQSWQRRLGISTQRRMRAFQVFDYPEQGSRPLKVAGSGFGWHASFGRAAVPERAAGVLATTLPGLTAGSEERRTFWLKPVR